MSPVRGVVGLVASVVNRVAAVFGIASTSSDPAPAGSVRSLLELAYVFRREVAGLLVNHAPVATALVPEPQDSVGAIFGRVEADDADGDTVTYAVGQAPTHGEVTVDKYSGEYLYRPNADAAKIGIEDSFTIVASDGHHALIQFGGDRRVGLGLFGGRTTVPVSVTVAPTAVPNDTRFDLVNLSLFPVKVLGYSNTKYVVSGPTAGDIIYPGQDVAVVLQSYSGKTNIFLQSAQFPDTVGEVPNEGFEYTVGFSAEIGPNTTECVSSGGRCATTQPSTAYLMDPVLPGPVDIFANRPELQAAYLTKVCGDSSRAVCKFDTSASSTKPIFSPREQYGESYTNNTNIVQSQQFTDTKTVSTTDSLSITGKLSKKLLFDINAEISVTASRSVTVTRTFTHTETVNAEPHKVTTLYVQLPQVQSTGNFIINIGETTVVLHDFTITVADNNPSHFGNFIAESVPSSAAD